jgi:hypothetical protein
MKHQELEGLVGIFRAFALNTFQQHPDESEIEAVIAAAAYGEKKLFEAIKIGVVTAREGAGAIAAEVHTWLIHRAELKWDQQPADRDWTELLNEVEQAVRECVAVN